MFVLDLPPRKLPSPNLSMDILDLPDDDCLSGAEEPIAGRAPISVADEDVTEGSFSGGGGGAASATTRAGSVEARDARGVSGGEACRAEALGV